MLRLEKLIMNSAAISKTIPSALIETQRFILFAQLKVWWLAWKTFCSLLTNQHTGGTYSLCLNSFSTKKLVLLLLFICSSLVFNIFPAQVHKCLANVSPSRWICSSQIFSPSSDCLDPPTGDAWHLHQECYTSQSLRSERDSNFTYITRADHEFYCSNTAPINHKVTADMKTQYDRERFLSHTLSQYESYVRFSYFGPIFHACLCCWFPEVEVGNGATTEGITMIVSIVLCLCRMTFSDSLQARGKSQPH